MPSPVLSLSGTGRAAGDGLASLLPSLDRSNRTAKEGRGRHFFHHPLKNIITLPHKMTTCQACCPRSCHPQGYMAPWSCQQSLLFICSVFFHRVHCCKAYPPRSLLQTPVNSSPEFRGENTEHDAPVKAPACLGNVQMCYTHTQPDHNPIHPAAST